MMGFWVVSLSLFRSQQQCEHENRYVTRAYLQIIRTHVGCVAPDLHGLVLRVLAGGDKV